MDIGTCFIAGFIGGLVAWEAVVILSIVLAPTKRDRAPDRAPESSTQPSTHLDADWKGVHLDLWA